MILRKLASNLTKKWAIFLFKKNLKNYKEEDHFY